MGSSTPCAACGCCCNAGGEATSEELPGASRDLENGRRTGTVATAEDIVNEIDLRVPNRMTKFVVPDRMTMFIIRGLLILLGLYLYNSMRRYAINYIGEDTWFSTFAVIVTAVPVAEFLCILDQVLTTPPPRSLEL